MPDITEDERSISRRVQSATAELNNAMRCAAELGLTIDTSSLEHGGLGEGVATYPVLTVAVRKVQTL